MINTIPLILVMETLMQTNQPESLKKIKNYELLLIFSQRSPFVTYLDLRSDASTKMLLCLSTIIVLVHPLFFR